MQLLRLLLYSHAGEIRELPFRLGAVNIITGASKTGKSSIIDIVRYCLGSTECEVAEGPIRRAVAWYACVFQLPNSQILIGRAGPERGKQSSSAIYFEVGSTLPNPPLSTLQQNIAPEALERLLAQLVGIRPQQTEPPAGTTRAAYEIGFKHSWFCVFQRQDEIATKRHLFHKHAEDFFSSAMRDTIPYFLGAVDEDRLERREELREIRGRLRALELRIAELRFRRQVVERQHDELIAEAIAVGLTSSETASRAVDKNELLRSLGTTSIVVQPTDLSEELRSLRREQTRIGSTMQRLRDDVAAARDFVLNEEGFTREGHEQASRLASIGVFVPTEPNNSNCPMCGSDVTDQLPLHGEIETSLKLLTDQLETVIRHQPRFRKFLEQREKELVTLSNQYEQNQLRLETLTQQDERLRRVADANSRKALTLGRISALVETIAEANALPAVEGEAAVLNNRRLALEEELGIERIRQKLDSAMNRIGNQMSRWAPKLDLEFSGYPLRIDLSHLNVVADHPDGPVVMDKMGSGENYVGYHLLALFAVHAHLIEQDRPVPRMLFLDQPTQVYYPPDRDQENGSVEPLIDRDRTGVIATFNFLFDVAEELSPNLQIIVTDHADLKSDERFQFAVVERWRRAGAKLVPEAWLVG